MVIILTPAAVVVTFVEGRIAGVAEDHCRVVTRSMPVVPWKISTLFPIWNSTMIERRGVWGAGVAQFLVVGGAETTKVLDHAFSVIVTAVVCDFASVGRN